MKTILRYLKPYAKKMSFGFCIKVCATVSELMLPYLLSFVLKDVITRSMGDIFFWGGLMVVFSLLACGLNIVANRMSAKVARDFAEAMRKDLFLSTLRLSAAQTDRFTIPSLESRITSDTYNVHNFISVIQRLGVRAPIMLFGGITITLFMDARLALVMVALVPLLGGLIYFIRIKGVPLYAKVQKSVDNMISVVRDDTQGMRVIKALSKTEFEHRRYDKVNRALVSDEIRTNVVMSAINPTMNIFLNFGCVAVIALGASYVSRGLSDPETIIAFMQYLTQISVAILSVTRIFVMYTKCAASAGRIEEVLLTEEDLRVAPASDFPAPDTDDHIVFDHVTFSYVGKRNNVDDVSFRVKRGQHVGIIGATGSSKTSLIRLLLRFYDPASGGIYIDGRDVRTIEKERLYAMFGTALQQDFLYADTIEENIRFGRDISADAVREAAEIAQADGFIRDFADGYDHELSPHGTNVSGGQKQRILIARALAAKPDILIFDDSSSALDYKTDAALRQALAEHCAGTTVLTVAQRVSSVKNCDCILVMDYGRIIGTGTHDTLMETCAEYREISESQMGGALID